MELCSICLDDISPGKNVITTECGHTFHCSCLMTNTAHNGFSCPYCRTEMAMLPNEESDEESNYESLYDDDDEEPYDDNVLTSFRMFQQRNDGYDIEEEPIDYSETSTIVIEEIPDAEYISEILIRQGVEVKDLIKCLLIDHEEYDGDDELNKKADRMYTRMRVIISNYVPPQSD